ncbi:MAG: ABC transporter permease subunit [Anaerolineae bacterium]|nr:ABC transporter permease subunit [Anaerolineae bacterium]
MVTTTNTARSPQGDLAVSNTNGLMKIIGIVLKYGGLMLLDGFALILIYGFFYDGAGGLAVTIALITIMANVFVLVPSLYPLKWMTPGLMLASLLVIYPIILTVQTAFTNYGDGNLFVKERVVDIIKARGYVPDSATTYKWVPFQLNDSEYALWLVDDAGQTLFVLPGEAPVVIDRNTLGYSEASSRYLFDPNTAELFDTQTGTNYSDVQVYFDGTSYGLWVFKDNGRNVLYAFPNMPIAETVFFQGRNLPRLAEGLEITYPQGETIPSSIGAFTRVENIAEQAEALSSLSLGVEDGDQLTIGNPDSIVPSLTGFTRIEDWNALAGINSLEYPRPLGDVLFQPIDLSARFIYDPQQALVNDQQSTGAGIDAYFDVTVYSNGSEYALWMIQLGSTEPNRALLALPNQPIQTLTLKDNRGNISPELNTLNIVLRDLTSGLPESIGDFKRTSSLPDESLVLGNETGLLKVGQISDSDRFVVDLEQRIAIDRVYGFTFNAIEFYAKDGDPNTIAIWLGNGNNPKRAGSAQFAAYIGIPNEITLVNNPSRVRPTGFIPSTYDGYTQLISESERTAGISFLQTVSFDYFGTEGDTLGVKDTSTVGRPYILRYQYDEATQTFTDLADNNKQYVADDVCDIPEGAIGPVCGFFTSAQGDSLSPGYRVNVGTYNFTRFVTEPALRGPMLDIFIWTVVFAALSVLTTFTVGLFMALILNDPAIPGRKLIRSLLIIPYTIPGVISILVWQGMLNQNLGFLTNLIFDITGTRIPWFADPVWAKVAIILVNLWLGYPYMMLISSGALQAIPSEVYEAAAVDGANPQQRFWRITLPLLLVTLGPLLIGSFVFNFNNYMLIAALTAGNPPIANSPVPAGYTDILISYTYRLAFGNSQGGADYGYAAAITIIIFVLVAIVTLIQYRYTKTWEQVGENV